MTHSDIEDLEFEALTLKHLIEAMADRILLKADENRDRKTDALIQVVVEKSNALSASIGQHSLLSFNSRKAA